jgi:Protein of unknown function (DUF4236)
MAFRFNKRISILPGIRLNLSKDGGSLSVGPRGASITLGKRGVFGNIAIPGTGLSYRERLDKPTSSARANSNLTAPDPNAPKRVNARLDGDAIVLVDQDQSRLDTQLERALRRTMKEELVAFLEAHKDYRNQEISALSRLHCDIPLSLGTISQGSIEKPLRDQFNAEDVYLDALMRWRAAIANQAPATDAIEGAVLRRLGSLIWPAETNIAISFANGRLLLDVDLPEIQDMPQSHWMVSKMRLAIESKRVSQKELTALYLEHVCSILVRLIGHSFAVTDLIRSVAVSAYTQRSASTGRCENEYVAAIEIDRNSWSQMDLTQLTLIDPYQMLRRFGASIEANSKGVLLIQNPIV